MILFPTWKWNLTFFSLSFRRADFDNRYLHPNLSPRTLLNSAKDGKEEAAISGSIHSNEFHFQVHRLLTPTTPVLVEIRFGNKEKL